MRTWAIQHLLLLIAVGGLVSPAFGRGDGQTLHNPAAVAAFYRERSGRPAWIGPDGKPGTNATALVKALALAWQDGLSPDDYHAGALAKLLAGDGGDKTAAERLLTDAYFSFGGDLFSGKLDPAAIDPDLALRHRRIDMGKELESALRSGDIVGSLRRLAPSDARYAKLKAALAAYVAMAARGPFAEVSEGLPLSLGMEGPRVDELRTRLLQEGYLKPSSLSSSSVFDLPMERALKAFQTSRGIEPSGVAESETIAALNVPVEELIRRLEANLERLRWLPRKLGSRYLFADIASFRLVAFDSGRPALDMRIIVGDEFRRTPMLSTSVGSIVLNPYWNIPPSIVENELLPHARHDPSYLRQRGIRVYEDSSRVRREIDPEAIDWSRIHPDGWPYLFQEHSGPGNPLGPVKFVLNNNRFVYLHGTPDRSLFEKTERTFSHGCIRVESPLDLALFLLDGSHHSEAPRKARPPAWTKGSLKAALDDGLQTSLGLPASVPVYLWYRTAWVDRSGNVQFRRDVYGWDAALADALEGRPLAKRAE